MNSRIKLASLLISASAFLLFNDEESLAQQQVQVIDYCANASTVTIPAITDMDGDGIDDNVEAALLQRYTPIIWQSYSDDCPSGSPVTGQPDGLPNLIACRVYYLPDQWLLPNMPPVPNPTPQAPGTGSVWYYARTIVNCAVLYGADCGTLGHLADIEAFYTRLAYLGGFAGGARYDTNTANWSGAWIETIAHQGTACEKREDGPYMSVAPAPSYSSLFSSDDKHGNYLTLTRCNGSCGDNCNNSTVQKSTLAFNAGEVGSPFVTDLGQFRSDYAGENPWGDQPFLERYGDFSNLAGAGTIKDKLLFESTKVRYDANPPLTCWDVCNWYLDCRGCSTRDPQYVYDECIATCEFRGRPAWRCF